MPIPFPHSHLKQALGEHFMAEGEVATTLSAEHELVLTVCDELERIADRLPEAPTAPVREYLTTALRVGIPAHCTSEESMLREHLATMADPHPDLSFAIDRLSAEHAENHAMGEEVADALDDSATYVDRADVIALGYQLRLCFQTFRRHLFWEEFLIRQLFAPDKQT